MKDELVLSLLIAAMVTLTTAIVAFYRIYITRKAEKHLTSKLASLADTNAEPKSEIEYPSDAMQLLLAQKFIDTHLNDLEESERNAIRTTIYQPNAIGQIKYIQKLLKESARILEAKGLDCANLNNYEKAMLYYG